MCLVGSTKCFARFIYATPRSKQLFEAKTKTEYPEQNPPMCFSTNNIMFWVSRLQFIIPTPISCWFLRRGAAGRRRCCCQFCMRILFMKIVFQINFTPAHAHSAIYLTEQPDDCRDRPWMMARDFRIDFRFDLSSNWSDTIRYDTIRSDLCLFVYLDIMRE